MALDWSKDISCLTEADLAGLSADELKILGRTVVSTPVYGTVESDRTGVPMSFDGDGARKRARVLPGSVVTALLKGWAKA